jgi:hypothetical protein
MSDPDETNALLREIRNLLAEREQQYKNHLANTEQAYDKQVKAGREYARRWAIMQWTALFFIVYAAVYCALTSAQ